ncbi:RagB/SusD family nutrient uptake outer membrane protein [Flavobacterium ovatum]|uniref:RagB/SusD family nutrient uptake outer membrane protein n=1 Tax=Flavobacterium ovatum TaxID=1928857 RepID=UPI00344BDAE7
MKNSTKYFVLLIAVFFTVSCSTEFLDNPPEDKLVLDNFYTSDGQILGSGGGLYGRPWFYFNEKFVYGLDTYAGNASGGYSDLAQFENFAVTGNNQFVFEGWQSLFNVIAQSNTLLYNLEKNVGPAATPLVVERVKGEAYFMRATAYFYLVRLFGAVPILNKIEQYTQKIPTYRNNVDDVYKFIINDFKEAQKRLPLVTGSSTTEKGRVIKSACDGMLAKVYITLKDYPNAKIHSENVINSGDYSLIDDYGLLFNSPTNNNSRESIFALQWVGCKGYGYGNSAQAYITPTGTITGDYTGWKTFLPSIDLRNAYEPNDKRRKATIMLPGDFYPELVTKSGGYTVGPSGFGGSMGFRKYVIGSTVEFANNCPQQTGQNTTMLRFAEIYLIHAEAILGNSTSTTDTKALTSFNLVRKRAGFTTDKTSITKADIFKERRLELVMEGDYWFDLVRRDRAEAKSIIENQERGVYSNISTLTISSKKVTTNANSFLLPIPASELDANPLLRENAVPFQF